jgi:hypothetical protein
MTLESIYLGAIKLNFHVKRINELLRKEYSGKSMLARESSKVGRETNTYHPSITF